MAATRRERRLTRSPMACRPSPRPCQTTRSRRWSRISAHPGAIAAQRFPRAKLTTYAKHRWIEGAMINSEHEAQYDDTALEPILQSGARGALALAGISTAVVVALWFAFYLLVFMPRATP